MSTVAFQDVATENRAEKANSIMSEFIFCYNEDMDIHGFLLEEFEKRKLKNPRTSLRSFARLLEIDPTTLGRILKGQGIPSASSILRFADRLKLTEEENLLLHEAFQKSKRNQKKSREENGLSTLEPDFFNNEFQWFFPLLLELVTAQNDVQPSTLAQALNLTIETIEKSLVLLEQHGLLQKNEFGHFKKVELGYDLGSLQHLPKHKAVHQDALQLALQRMTDEKIHGYYASLPLTLDAQGFENICAVLRKTQLRMSRMAQKDSDQKSQVYHLNIALHSVNK